MDYLNCIVRSWEKFCRRADQNQDFLDSINSLSRVFEFSKTFFNEDVGIEVQDDPESGGYQEGEWWFLFNVEVEGTPDELTDLQLEWHREVDKMIPIEERSYYRLSIIPV
jgi:hypothetical protein